MGGGQNLADNLPASLSAATHPGSPLSLIPSSPQGLTLYDPLIKAAMYDMRAYETHPGNSSLFREGTVCLKGGIHSQVGGGQREPATQIA